MTNQELYKQAILDAKAVRETALAAARETLAEAFEPKLKEMVRMSLSEEDDTMDEAESTHTKDVNAEKAGKKVAKDIEYDEKHGKMHEAEEMEESTDMEESTLDEILAELDRLSEDDKELDEAKKQGTTAGYSEKAHTESGKTGYDEKAKTSHGDHKLHEAEDEEEVDSEEEVDVDVDADVDTDADVNPDAEMATDDQEVVDITVGDLKDIIRDVFMSLQGGGDEDFDTDTLDLDSPDQAMADDEMEVTDDEEISLDEILAELEKDEMKESTSVPGAAKQEVTYKASDIEEAKKMKKDLEEANKAVKAMKAELNEVNLLNAKLLYVNKIFKAKSLNESQKVKVLNAFDRATSIKEVENTYKTLNESIGEVSKKTSLKESVGFASKAIGSAPARPIVDADPFINRWQQLAGIK